VHGTRATLPPEGADPGEGLENGRGPANPPVLTTASRVALDAQVARREPDRNARGGEPFQISCLESICLVRHTGKMEDKAAGREAATRRVSATLAAGRKAVGGLRHRASPNCQPNGESGRWRWTRGCEDL
jgi:hypothetical protein